MKYVRKWQSLTDIYFGNVGFASILNDKLENKMTGAHLH